VAEVEECQPSKHKALSSNPSTAISKKACQVLAVELRGGTGFFKFSSFDLYIKQESIVSLPD
jgi:hypothetical protein